MKKIKAFSKPVDTIVDDTAMVVSTGNRRLDSYALAALQGLLAGGTTYGEDHIAEKAVSLAIKTIEKVDQTLTDMVL